MVLTCKEFCDVLGKINKATPRTKEIDENPEYKQKNGRWWDILFIGTNIEDMSRQKFHVHGHFLCKCYDNPRGCKENCAECYTEKKCNPKNREIYNDKVKLENIYYGMQRPEMYLFIVEAFEILEKDKLAELMDYVIKNYDPSKPVKVCKEIRKMVTWDMVENKVLEKLKNI